MHRPPFHMMHRPRSITSPGFGAKANLNPPSNTLVEYNKHTDQKFKCKAAIYYVNSNDGYTIIGDQKIESKANRIVFFDADVPHSGTNSTDCKNRMVINFNYF